MGASSQKRSQENRFEEFSGEPLAGKKNKDGTLMEMSLSQGWGKLPARLCSRDPISPPRNPDAQRSQWLLPP